MNFFNPLAWIGLLAIPAILIMYLLKQKYKDMTVPSLFLWKEALNMSKAQRPWQKLRRNLLMFLQILLAFLLVVSLAGPYFSAQTLLERCVLILDSSMSMQAADVTPTRFEKAKEEMVSFVSDAAPGTKITVIVAGALPYIAVNASDDKKTVINSIKAVKPSYTGMDEKTTASLVIMQTEHEESAVYLFSDHHIDFEGVEKQDILFGQSADNMAVTLLTHIIDADRVVALAKVKNFGAGVARNSVAMYVDDAFHDMKDVSLEPGEEKDVFFTTLPLDAKNLECRLTEGDVLAADDTRYGTVHEPIAQRVMLVTAQNVFLENILSLLPNVTLFKTSPDNTADLSGCYLYVFDGAMPDEIPADGHILVFNPPEGNTLLPAGEETPVSGMDSKDSGLLRLIGDWQFAVSKSRLLTPPSWMDVVLAADETPLIMTGQQNNQKVVVMGFDLHNTDLPLRKEFPIFMYNLMQYFIPGGVAADEALLTGTTVTLNTYPDAQKVSVITPERGMDILAPPFPVPPYDGARTPGVYTLVQDTPVSTVYGDFAVNVVTDESDLIITDDTVQTQARPQADVRMNKNLAPVFLVFVLLILIAEWWVFSRGR